MSGWFMVFERDSRKPENQPNPATPLWDTRGSVQADSELDACVKVAEARCGAGVYCAIPFVPFRVDHSYTARPDEEAA